jgi:hypothetical protein
VVGHQPLSGRLCGTTARGTTIRAISRFLSERRRSLFDQVVPATWSWAFVTIGLPATQGAWTRTGFPRFACMRYGRGGCPLYPGGGGVPATGETSPVAACRFSTASPCHPALQPASGSCSNEAYEPGRVAALLRRPPLRAVRARHRAYGPSRSSISLAWSAVRSPIGCTSLGPFTNLAAGI